MKFNIKIGLIALLLFNMQFTFAQNFQTVEDVDSSCAQLGFMANEEAEIAVDRILESIGLFRNFVLQQCPDINNAVAKNIRTSTGEVARYILYDNEFFNRINDKASNDWAAISILAHEIGHHLNGHSLNNKGSNHKYELEADYFSGLSLAKMGATLEEAQSAIQTLRYEKATRTHPAKADRLEQIAKGWRFANKEITNKKEEEEDVPFTIIETVPQYPGCSGNNAQKKRCMNLKIRKHIGKHFNVEVAQELGFKSKCLDEREEYNDVTNLIEKKCYKWRPIKILSQFKIMKDGTVQVTGVRAPHPRLQEETKRVIKMMPNMNPGTQRGKPVNVGYTLPISFVIEGY